MLKNMVSRVQPALTGCGGSPSKSKGGKQHKEKKHKREKQKDGVRKRKAGSGSGAVDRLREERRKREAAEHLKQEKILQQPDARCEFKLWLQNPIYITPFRR